MVEAPSVTPPKPTLKDTSPRVQAAKATAAGLSLPVMLALIPEPYAHWVMLACVFIASSGFAATFVDPPKDPNSRWMWLYNVLQFLAQNYAKAANAALMLRQGEHPKGPT